MKLLRKQSPTPSLGTGYQLARKRPLSDFFAKLTFPSPRSTSSLSTSDTHDDLLHALSTTPTSSPPSSNNNTNRSSASSSNWMAKVRQSDDDALTIDEQIRLLLDSIRYAFFNEPEATFHNHIHESLRRMEGVDPSFGRDAREGVTTLLEEGQKGSLGAYLVWLENHVGEEKRQDGQWTSRAWEAEKISPIITLLAESLAINPSLNTRPSIEALEAYDPEVALFVSLVCTNLSKGVITSRHAVETLFDICEDLETRIKTLYSDETQSRYRTNHFSFFWMLGSSDPRFLILDSARPQMPCQDWFTAAARNPSTVFAHTTPDVGVPASARLFGTVSARQKKEKKASDAERGREGWWGTV